jgi:hypothetical membrane protein
MKLPLSMPWLVIVTSLLAGLAGIFLSDTHNPGAWSGWIGYIIIFVCVFAVLPLMLVEQSFKVPPNQRESVQQDVWLVGIFYIALSFWTGMLLPDNYPPAGVAVLWLCALVVTLPASVWLGSRVAKGRK